MMIYVVIATPSDWEHATVAGTFTTSAQAEAVVNAWKSQGAKARWFYSSVEQQ